MSIQSHEPECGQNRPEPERVHEIDREELGRRVLSLIQDLEQQINPRRTVRAQLASSLQRDLGFDSLTLAELLLRTEKEFKTRLPDDLIGRLDTPADLISEIESSDRTRAAEFVRTPGKLPTSSIDAAPEIAATLIETLDWHVRHHPDRAHILLSDGYTETETITYQDLQRSARMVAAGLQEMGLEPDDCVGVMLPTGQEFFEAVFGILFAGGVPVPMYPPMRLSQLEEHLRRQAKILGNCRARLLFIPEEGKSLAGLLGGQVETLQKVLTVNDASGNEADFDPIPRRSDDLALLQYTSGSTGDPKGVMLTHANLLANVRSMGSAIEASSSDVFVSWLPLYHDLGLIGAWFGSLYHAVPAVIMSPLRFIVRPESWLWAIHRNRATITAAPNFAFELCTNKIDDAALQGLDLSSLRMVANGAEPVSAETIRRFAERFQAYGFRREVMAPVYGLAENSVGLAFSRLGEAPIVDRVDRATLARAGTAIPAGHLDENPVSFVSSGIPLPDHDIRILDEIGREAPERQVGRLEFKGPSATGGYFRNSEKTKSLFHGNWLDSGDLAYIASGNIFITGRVKDIIIKGGRNIYPEEIEQAVGDLDGVRKGCVAAFASTDPETATERLIIAAEARSTDPETQRSLQEDVAQKVFEILELPADRVLIIAPHSVPKTSSGKIRRSTTRELFEAGDLGKSDRALWLQVLRLRGTSILPRLRKSITVFSDVIYAAWFWTVLALVGTFTWVGVLLLPTQKLRWALLRFSARGALRLLRIPLNVDGTMHLSADPGIIVANHSSYADVLVLSAVLPGEPTFIAKAELKDQLIAGPFLRRLGIQFVKRGFVEAGAKETERYGKLVQNGRQLVFFPEGTFLRNPGFLPFRLGAFSVACAIGSAVRPIVIAGTRSILRGEQWFPRRGSVIVSALDPLIPSDESFRSAVELKETVRSSMITVSGEPDLSERVVVFEGRGEQASADRQE